MLSFVAPSSRLQGATTESVTIAMHSESRQVGKEPYILLSTAIVNVIGNSGNFENARVILDAGSQSNFMTRELCSRLNLPVRKVDIKVIGLNSSTSNACLRTTATIKSSTSNFSVKLSFLVVNKITECIPTVSFDASKLGIPESVTLADPTFNVSNQIDVLIGTEIYHDLLAIGRIKLGTGKPTLVKSRLGWILSGPILFHDPKQTRHCNLSSNQDGQDILEQFWHIEDVEIPSVRKESECERIFRETLNTDESGRYVVQLPMVNSGLRLGNSLDTAISRYYALERKLNSDPELHRRYHDFMTRVPIVGTCLS
ncbi:uncharacterized protein LOC123671941 [Harmonia axyridis]|uniref:uncharacterized protein LOC123671941 n=1 Tax=Harmonia axyridis TaxID=115357 RepID=UPI001E277493|nr:uncharacterized protein LOC123671941 [Harmonia axyridis]